MVSLSIVNKMQHPKAINDHLPEHQLDRSQSNTKITPVDKGIILQLTDGNIPICNIMALKYM